MDPGSPAFCTLRVPQAGILDQSSSANSITSPKIPAKTDATETRRRPQTPYEPKCKEQIEKAIEALKTSGRAENTVRDLHFKLNQLDRYADLMNPTDVKSTIAYAKVANVTKSRFCLAYRWFAKINGIQWEEPRYKWTLPTPIIPTTDNVSKIISAASKRYATIFTLLAETGAEAEELHRTHRNQIDTEQAVVSIRGTKGHASASYKLKTATNEMLKEYLKGNPQDYPFPRAKFIGEMWRDTRNKLADTIKQPQLRQIPLKSLRNYSGAQLYYKTNDPIAVMRHLRHKKLETTMHYLRAITIGGDEEYTCKAATTPEEAKQLIEDGFTYVQTIDNIHLYRKRK